MRQLRMGSHRDPPRYLRVRGRSRAVRQDKAMPEFPSEIVAAGVF
jgi:hypothetical protein